MARQLQKENSANCIASTQRLNSSQHVSSASSVLRQRSISAARCVTHRCCEVVASAEPFAEPRGGGRPHPPTFAPRFLDIAAWIAPGAILALLPKCPICLAAYVAIGTGIGLSLPTATYLRASLLTLCVASLLYLLVKRLYRFVVPRGPFESEETSSTHPSDVEQTMSLSR
jgi:hypothetical protein